MKCELCHEKDAETAINVVRDGVEDELYVCSQCAKKERVKRQKKSQRTRRASGSAPGVEMSITEVSGGEGGPPPIVEALMSAMNDVVDDINKELKRIKKESDKINTHKSAEETDEPEVDENGNKMVQWPCERVEKALRIGSRLHLEGLSLIGDIGAVSNALEALGMRLDGVSADGVYNAAHAYKLKYSCSVKRAKRVVQDLLRQERNARIRLLDELPRVLGDAICRALAILKNCRMLSNGELFDLLSPIRLAALDDLLEGITLKKVSSLLDGVDLSSDEDMMEMEERERLCAERADRLNAIFEDVVLNERAERKLL